MRLQVAVCGDVAAAAQRDAAAARNEAAAFVDRIDAEVTALRGSVEEGRHGVDESRRALAELAAQVARGVETTHALEERLTVAVQAADVDREELRRIAAAEEAAQTSQAEALGALRRSAAEVAEFRTTVEARQGAQDRQLVWLQSRLTGARRVAVKLVRRVQATGRDAEQRIEAREAECDRRMALVREDTATLLADVRRQHGELAARVEAAEAA